VSWERGRPARTERAARKKMSVTLTRPVTADELLAMPDDGYRYELVKGELFKMPPTGDEHGEVTMDLASPLHVHVKKHNLGKVYAAETGFKLESDPDTVRAPEIAFVRQERVEATGRMKGYRPGAPDLVVEVLSPNDRMRYVEAKVAQWFESGARLIWVVSPKLRTITVYHSRTDMVVLTEKDTLDGGDVVPGFHIEVARIFGS
jgi:Uma2 family endonuclease